MCRRRFFKSYLYIEYGGIKYKNGETVSVSPFLAEGNSTTIVLDSARPWNITNNISWLTVSSSSNKSGTYTITLAAAANQSYDGRSGSFTAKTLDDRYSIVVSVSQRPKASENYIYVTPQQITLDAEDIYDALNCNFYHNGQSPVPVTPVWSTESDVISINADGVVTSNNQTAQAFENIEVWAKYVYEEDELWDSMKVNVNAASIQRFITVEPQSVSMEATGAQQLAVTYHEIINNHETTRPVTNSSEYGSDSQVITVNDTGLISANNQSEDPATATITVTYDSVLPVNVPVTANSANVEYRNLSVEPSEMSLRSSDVENGQLVHAYVDEYINGQPTGVVVEVTSAATWNSNHTDVATVSSTGNNEVIKPVYGSGYFPDERDATITGSYLGMTDTCEVTVEPEGRIEQYLTVQPSTTSITSTGGVQLDVKLITKTDGRVTGEEPVTDKVTYGESSPLINVNSTGYVSATGGETGGQAIVTIRYPGHNVDDISATINVQDASVDEYLEITPASTSTTWNGQVTYEVFYVKKVNTQEVERVEITDASVLRFDLTDETVGEMNGFVFNAENISTAYTDEEISVTCTAGTYNGLSTKTPAELRVNGADSVAPRLDITAPKYNMASAETMQISATYVIVVNGNDYKTETLNPTAVTWDENSNYASISNASSTAGRLRSNNTTNSVQHVTATGEYNTTEFGKVTGYSADIYIAAAPITRNIDVTVYNKVTSNAGGNCGSLEISWTGLTVGTYIDIIPTNASVAPEIQVTATTGSLTLQNTPTIEANYGGSRSVGVKAQWREDTSINDTEQWTQSGGYVSPQIEVNVNNKVTSNAGGNCERLTVSWTALTVGTYIDLASLNADLPDTQILIENATDSAYWDEYPVIGQNTGDERIIAVSATWRSDSDVYDAESWAQDGGYEPPTTPVHIYIDSHPDNYAVTLDDGVSFGESYTLTWDPDVNPATFGYTIDPQTNAITSATIDYENSSFEVSGEANVTGNDKLGKVYITANTYSDVTRVVTFEFTLTQSSLIVTELNINGSTEKYLMLSGQMISFEVQDQNGNTLQSGLSPTNYYAVLFGNGVTSDLAIWGYENGKAWVICKRNIVTKKDYSVVFYTRESGGDVNVSCTIHCVPITLTATPSEFPQTGGTGTLSIKTYGNYNWSVYDDPEELLDMSVTGTSVGQGDTDGIGFAVYENMSEENDSDYFYAVVNVVDEYGNSLTGQPIASISQETYTPTPVRTTDAIICLSARSESCVTVNTGIEIRYDNLGDLMGNHEYGTPLYNDFHISVPSLNTYANAEAYIVIFGHYLGGDTEKLATGDTEYLATMGENTSSRLVTLLGNDPGHSYQNAFVANNDIVEVIGEIQEGHMLQVVIDDIQFVTSPRGKTIHASSFAPQQFTLTYENPIAKITAVTFEDNYTRTVWTDNTGGTGGFGFTVNYDQIDELIISWDVNGITGATFVDGDRRTRISNGDSVFPTNLSGTVSFSSLGLATDSGKVYIEGRYLGVTKEQFELPIIYEEPED